MSNQTEKFQIIVQSAYCFKEPKTYYSEGSLEELIKYYEYSLQSGKSYENEKGKKKVNLNPKSIKGLVKSLQNAYNNCALHGFSGKSVYWKAL